MSRKRPIFAPPSFCLSAGLLFLAACGVTMGQPFALETTQSSELTDASLNELGAGAANELVSVRELLGEGEWDEAVDRLVRLAESGDDRLIQLAGNRYIPLRLYCHRLIGQMPAPALELYRQRVDPLAQQWYREGVDERNAERLRQVVDVMFCSSWGDDALLALGEMALERGEYADARSCWERISPLLRGPHGRPLWLALRDIDLDTYWSRIEPILKDRKTAGDWIAYPDTDIDLATVRARLALVSIRERSFGRAEVELAALAKTDPDAKGRIGGQHGRLAKAISEQLTAAKTWPSPPIATDWTTFGGSPRRTKPTPPAGAVAGPAWEKPVALVPAETTRRGDRRRIEFSLRRVAEDASRPLSVHPIVVRDLLLFCDAERIYARHMASGEPALTETGVLYAPDRPAPRPVVAAAKRIGVPRFTMTAVEDRVYARMGYPARNRVGDARRAGNERLVGLDLSQGGRLLFQHTLDNADWAFGGAPIADEDHLYMALRQSDVTPRSYVACLDGRSGRMKWRTFVAGGNTPATSGPDAVSNHLLTRADGTLFFNTDLGAVAALSANDGHIQWIARYDRSDRADLSRNAAHLDRDLTPCVYDQGLLFVAPSDSPLLFALDAMTGETIWVTNRPADVVHLLGIADGNLIASGDRLWWIDTQSGRVVGRWPETEMASIRGYGRGFVAGQKVYWPTRDHHILVFRTAPEAFPEEGLRPIEKINLAMHAMEAGNLLAVDGLLLITSPDTLDALGPFPRKRHLPVQGRAATFRSKEWK